MDWGKAGLLTGALGGLRTFAPCGAAAGGGCASGINKGSCDHFSHVSLIALRRCVHAMVKPCATFIQATTQELLQHVYVETLQCCTPGLLTVCACMMAFDHMQGSNAAVLDMHCKLQLQLVAELVFKNHECLWRHG